MTIKPASIFNFIFFGAIPVVFVVIFLMYIVTSRIINKDESVDFSDSKISVISAQKFPLENNDKLLKPVSMDLIDDSLIVSENIDGNLYDINPLKTGIGFVSSQNDDAERNEFVFQLDNNEKFGIQRIIETKNNIKQETGIKIVNLTKNIIISNIYNHFDENSEKELKFVNRTIISKDKRYIALVFSDIANTNSKSVITVWNLAEAKTARDLEVSNFRDIKFTSDSQNITIHYKDNKTVYFYNIKDNIKDFTMDFPTDIDHFDFVNDARRILVLAYFEPTLDFRVFETQTDQPIQILYVYDYLTKTKLNEAYIFESKLLRFFPLENSNLIALIRENGYLEFFDINTGEIVKNYYLGIDLKIIADSNIQLSSDLSSLIIYDKNGEIQIIKFKVETTSQCNRFSFSIQGLRCLFRIDR